MWASHPLEKSTNSGAAEEINVLLRQEHGKKGRACFLELLVRLAFGIARGLNDKQSIAAKELDAARERFPRITEVLQDVHGKHDVQRAILERLVLHRTNGD